MKTTFDITPWVLAARPKTLPAAIFPILVAWTNCDWTAPNKLLIILLVSVLLQILSNYSNDLFDGIRGNDGQGREGPKRMIQSGVIKKRQMFRAILGLVGLLTCLGLVLYAWSGWLILVLGIFAIVCAIAYTASPYAFAYNGLGEVAVGIFFGGVAVLGSEYILLEGHLSYAALPCAGALGLHAIAILLVNNIRDRQEDIRNGKYTLSTRIGRAQSEKLYKLCIAMPIALVTLAVIVGAMPPACLIVFLNIPLIQLASRMISMSGEKLNALLALSSFLLVNFSLLYIAGHGLTRMYS